MISWFTAFNDKDINANVYRHSLWECPKPFHCSFEWHLTPHVTLYRLYVETCVWPTAFPEGVRSIQVSLYSILILTYALPYQLKALTSNQFIDSQDYFWFAV